MAGSIVFVVLSVLAAFVVNLFRAGVLGDNPLRGDHEPLEYLSSNGAWLALTIIKSLLWPYVLIGLLIMYVLKRDLGLGGFDGRGAWIAVGGAPSHPSPRVIRRKSAVAEGLLEV